MQRKVARSGSRALHALLVQPEQAMVRVVARLQSGVLLHAVGRVELVAGEVAVGVQRLDAAQPRHLGLAKEGDQDFIKKLLSYVPGFKGYIERSNRRSADKLLRDQVALKYMELSSRASGLQKDLVEADQIDFVTTFVRCEGKLNRMEKETGLSYPTLRSRLTELIRAMGFEVGQEEPPPPASGVTDGERRAILEDLAAGRLSTEQAVKSLQGG